MKPGPRRNRYYAPLHSRTHRLNMMFRKDEIADLRRIAQEWKTYPATAAWAIVASFICEVRGDRMELTAEALSEATLRLVAGLSPCSCDCKGCVKAHQDEAAHAGRRASWRVAVPGIDGAGRPVDPAQGIE